MNSPAIEAHLMSIPELFRDLADHLHSDAFRQSARHPEFPSAFSRQRKLPLPALVAVMLTGMRSSVQVELDQFFSTIQQKHMLCRHVSEQAFAQARAKLSPTALDDLNRWLIQRNGNSGVLWHGHRLVAADASRVQFGIRTWSGFQAANAEQIAFGLYLPGSEMMLAASLHSTSEAERQMLFEHLDDLAPNDLLLMDRGYPASWLIATLNDRGQAFCMRADNMAFKIVRSFARSNLVEQVVKLSSPTPEQVKDYECSAEPPVVRLVRQITPSGEMRVLMTNLMDSARYPAIELAQLYHHRWRIEEAFKRLKHRLKLEHVSGLTQLAVRQDFAAKILCDNLHSIVCSTAHESHDVSDGRAINRSYAISALRRVLPCVILGYSWALELLVSTMALIATRTHQKRPGKSNSRPPGAKPHLHGAYKAC